LLQAPALVEWHSLALLLLLLLLLDLQVPSWCLLPKQGSRSTAAAAAVGEHAGFHQGMTA
jgi:hypothetical protein